jgi:DinB superfamily
VTDPILTGASPQATRALLEEASEFTPASRAMDGLSAAQALMKPAGSPYSVAEIVSHMVFWQRYVIATIAGEPVEDISSAATGWSAVSLEDWPRLKDEFLANLERCRDIAGSAATLERVPSGNRSVGYRLLSHARHNAYHLGQIVLLRRILGFWPPPGGGDTW